jgi:hypothetical protein
MLIVRTRREGMRAGDIVRSRGTPRRRWKVKVVNGKYVEAFDYDPASDSTGAIRILRPDGLHVDRKLTKTHKERREVRHRA